MKHGVIVGGTGAGKSTFLENIIAQDMTRRFGARKMPMIIFDGKGEREFLDRLLPHIEAAGRLQDLRVIDPTHPVRVRAIQPLLCTRRRLPGACELHLSLLRACGKISSKAIRRPISPTSFASSSTPASCSTSTTCW